MNFDRAIIPPTDQRPFIGLGRLLLVPLVPLAISTLAQAQFTYTINGRVITITGAP